MTEQRRHDLDWLRVGAFLLLILYHIGMFYVPWGWHVKSLHAPVSPLELPMKLTNAWRLPLLFLISGVALRYALDKTPRLALLKRRIWVLLVPLLFGMYVICAPQAWHELTQSGVWQGTIAAFYKDYVNWPWASPPEWPIITPTWNHLWYVLYVLVYSVILILLSTIRTGGSARLATAAPALLVVPAAHIGLMLILFEHVGKAQTLYGDWYNLMTSFLIMAFGFAIAKQAIFWSRLKAWRYGFLSAAVLLSGLVGYHHFVDLPRTIELGTRILQGWMVIWALLGWGQVLLANDTPVLRYLSDAVFTYYILHQTLIIVIGVPLSALALPMGVEIAVLCAGTGALCWAGYEIIARRMGRFGILLGARN